MGTHVERIQPPPDNVVMEMEGKSAVAQAIKQAVDSSSDMEFSLFQKDLKSREQDIMSKKFPNNRNMLKRQNSTGSIQRSVSKRRLTYPSGGQDLKYPIKRRRRVNSVALPTKFLLGGNINDPLNLKSLEDEEVNRRLNAFTPASSPIPLSAHRTQIQVRIPPNIYDPLNLNTGEEIEFNLMSPRTRKRKRHHKRSTTKKEEAEFPKEATYEENLESASVFVESEGDSELPTSSAETEPPQCQCTGSSAAVSCEPDKSLLCEAIKVSDAETTPSPKKPKPSEAEISKQSHPEKPKINIVDKNSEEKLKMDKIVSPVVPQGSPLFYKKGVSKGVKLSEVAKLKKGRRSRYWQKRDLHSNIKFKESDEKYAMGSLPYHYRCTVEQDSRLGFLSKELFCGKEVLDIGCSVGCLAMNIAEHFEPAQIIGIDVSLDSVRKAQKHLRDHLNASLASDEKFPVSMSMCYGPVIRMVLPSESDSHSFPNNIRFCHANYVPDSDEDVHLQQPEFDIILCLRVTKWIHLNYGDEGLKISFRRMFSQLRCGGHLILEPQPWSSYARKKKLSPKTFVNYNNIELKPDKFISYLLSKDVGFTSCKVLGRSYNSTTGVRQPVYMLTKSLGFSPSEEAHHSRMVSPVVFNDIEWSGCCEEERGSSLEWEENGMSNNGFLGEGLSPSQTEDISHYDLYHENQMLMDSCYFLPSEYDSGGDICE